ncbi:MAG: S-layer region-like protein [uncultured bacterium]|nr:MAG: S-layer region-like protein [uncultured bacterium]HBH18316.1 hypothetical protein [Cyanobacteria bacterium UBA9579]
MNFRKKFVGAALTANLLSLSLLPVLAAEFSDLKSDYWAYDSVQALSQQGILSGYADSSFRPNNPVTRAEFATMIVKSLGKESIPIGQEFGFKDVSRSFWAYDTIQRAYDLGLIRGFPDNTFKPYAYITKTEVLAILSSAAQLGYLSQSEAQQILNRYYDASRVANWAVVPVAKSVKAGLAVNYPQPNFLMPEKRATRAEVAVMLQNLRRNLGMEAPVQQAQQPAFPQPGYQQPVQQNPYQVPQQSYQQQTQQPASVEQISQYAADGGISNVILRGSIATVESNSVIPTQVETPLSSEIANVGDTVVLRVPNSVTTSQGTLLIPAGSRISGKIIAVTPAKHANRNARINIDFNSITLPSGQSFPLQASVATETGLLEAGSMKASIGEGLLKTAIGAGSGAALGTALGAITGSTGKGAIYGTAIGGGLGVVGAVLQRGGAIEIPSGEPLFIKLERPLSIDVRTGIIVQ